MKKLIGQIHLWLGLVSGLFVFIIAITGSIYAFKEEIENASQAYRFVEAQEKEFLPPSTLVAIAEKALPNKHVHAVMYGTRKNAAKAIFYSEAENYYDFVYIDPYSGRVLEIKDETNGFFRFILNGHFYLWLPPKLGQPFVASVTLCFFVLLLSGLFLWWPRAKNGKRQRFKIKLNARWRRKNYDLHSILGFYILSLAIIFSVTGLVWGFQWFNKTYYSLISGGKKFIDYQVPLSTFKKLAESQAPIDAIWFKLRAESPPSSSIEIHTPEDSVSAIAANVNPDPTTYWKTDFRYFDQYSLQELNVNHVWGRYHNLSKADKLLRMNYDIHVGGIWGLPGKILAFFASLIVASLPITGFLLWYGRKKNVKIKQSNAVQATQG